MIRRSRIPLANCTEATTLTKKPLGLAILAPSTNPPYFSQGTFDLTCLDGSSQDQYPYPSPDILAGPYFGDEKSHNAIAGDHQDVEIRPQKRIKVEQQIPNGIEGSNMDPGAMAAPPATGPTAPAEPAASRPKRVRTGCLTCRERHLKCDEGTPDCQNCRKSSRPCKRGVRLNFIDTQVKSPPITPPTHDWEVGFQDESREIASEYRGGLGRYAHIPIEQNEAPDPNTEAPFEFPTGISTPTLSHQQLPSISSLPPGGVEAFSGTSQQFPDQVRDSHRHSSANSDSTFSSSTIPAPPQPSYGQHDPLSPPHETRHSLNSPEELLFMQVFVEEVGLWMDSMDPYKHV